MSKARLLELADYIEGVGGDDFSITDYAQCFCGKAEAVGMHLSFVVSALENEMGVDSLPFAKLIAPYWGTETYLRVQDKEIDALYPREQAVRTLRHFAETGTVDWAIGAIK